MTSPFDPKQLEAQARAFSDKVFNGLNDLLSGHRSSADSDASGKANAGMGAQFDAMRDEVKSTLDAQMVAFLQKMNVVTREDYELQAAMLRQTQLRVEELERLIAELQAEIAQPSDRS